MTPACALPSTLPLDNFNPFTHIWWYLINVLTIIAEECNADISRFRCEDTMMSSGYAVLIFRAEEQVDKSYIVFRHHSVFIAPKLLSHTSVKASVATSNIWKLWHGGLQYVLFCSCWRMQERITMEAIFTSAWLRIKYRNPVELLKNLSILHHLNSERFPLLAKVSRIARSLFLLRKFSSWDSAKVMPQKHVMGRSRLRVSICIGLFGAFNAPSTEAKFRKLLAIKCLKDCVLCHVSDWKVTFGGGCSHLKS